MTPLLDRRQLNIFAAALLVSLSVIVGVFSYVTHQGPDPFTEIVFSQKDSREYRSLADSLSTQGKFIRADVRDPKPELFRVPLYPLFLAFVQRISLSPFSIPVAQAILFSLSCALIYSIGARIASPTIGLVASIAYFAIPATHHLYLLALSETLFQFVFLLWTYVLLLWLERKPPSVGLSLLFGGISGSLVLLRAASLFLLPYTFGLIFLQLALSRTRPNKEQYLTWGKHIIAVLAVFCVLTGGWTLRNRHQAGFTNLSTIGSYNLFYYNFADFTSARLGLTRDQALDHQLTQIGLTQATADRNDPAVIQRFSEFNRDYLRRYGPGYVTFHLKKTLLFFVQSDAKSFFVFLHTTIRERGEYTDPALIDFFTAHQWRRLGSAILQNPRELLFLIERISWLGLLLFSVVSLVLVPREHRNRLSLLFGIAIYFALITGPVLMPRYRLPTAPSLLLLTCIAGQQIWQRYQQRTSSRASETH